MKTLINNEPKNTEDLEAAGYKNHHSAWTRGYVSRKNNTEVLKGYKGKFGEGYAVLTASFESTQYCRITYYVK
jgi:hypothetical protein